MPEYKSKQELLDEISNSARLFINEFSDIQEADKVAPFKSFRSKIRKWKRVIQDNVQDLVNEVPYEKEK